MKTILVSCALAVLLAACGSPSPEGTAGSGAMRLMSASFADGQPIPAVHSRDGGDRAPELHWSGVPPAAQSLALLCEDVDAPGGAFTHWIVVDMLPVVPSILEGAPKTKRLMNGGLHGVNSYGDVGWGGPQPPSGTHRYVFTLYALDAPSTFTKEPTREEFAAAVKGHTLATAALTGLFSAP